jgi:hypothetical protein
MIDQRKKPDKKNIPARNNPNGAYKTMEKPQDNEIASSKNNKSKFSMQTDHSRQGRMADTSMKSEVKNSTPLPLIDLSVNMSSLKDMLK